MKEPLISSQRHEDDTVSEEIAQLQEELRAAEKRGTALPPEDLSDPSGVDWSALERLALHPTFRERMQHGLEKVPAKVLARSWIIPALLFSATILVLVTFDFGSSWSTLLSSTGVAFVVLSISFLWGVTAFQVYAQRTIAHTRATAARPERSQQSHFNLQFAFATPVIVIVAGLVAIILLPYLKQRRPKTAVTEGSVALEQNHYSDALQSFEKASALLEQDDPAVYFVIGNALYQKCMTLNADLPQERDAQGEVCRAAISYLKRGAAIDASATVPQVRIAELQYVLDDLPSAAQRLASVLSRPDLSPAERSRAVLILAAVTEKEVAKERGPVLSPERLIAIKSKLHETIEQIKAVDAQNPTPELSAALLRLHLAEATIAPPGEQQSLTDAAIDAFVRSARNDVGADAGLR